MEAAGFTDSVLSGHVDWGTPHPLAATGTGGVGTSGLWRLLRDNGFEDLRDGGAEAFVRSWLPLRHSFVLDRMRQVPIEEDGRIKVLRELCTDIDTAHHLRQDTLGHGLGVFWSFDQRPDDRAAWGHGDVFLCMHGMVNPDQIEWMQGMSRNMDYLTGDDESELHLPDAEVELVKIVCGRETWGQDMIVSPVRRTTLNPDPSLAPA